MTDRSDTAVHPAPTTRTGGVRLDRVTKRFRSGTIGVDDVSLTVEPGEFVTFLGPSGSGKTTTLNTIAGFAKPSSGRIEIAGADVTALPPSKRNLGVVFQNYALFPHMTVRENIAFGLHGRGLSKAEIGARIEESLAMVRLDGLGDRTPKQISGGQQQRVALARALVYRPPVLLMDEPLGALDKALRDRMQVEISRIHREVGTTFLFVTHDQGEALGLSDRIVLFDRGRVVQVGAPTELYERPASLFAAEFLGESNVFRGELAGPGALRFGEQTLRCMGDGPASGSAAVVVRPERLRLVGTADASGRTDASGTENRVEARVVNIAYFGAFRRVTLRYADGSSGLLHDGVDAPAPISLGDPVVVGWDAEHAVVVPVPAPAEQAA
ncbi:ABC transporter ATP-binding protein [Agromyces mediolanus]|uniref:ABC transporter ATP-binding protein n=1 Tax=Agromyces mediolanus TaxID=41986 RepID=UPI001E5E5B99|nr:ABC transporter ATP-binding protein [Agromyces mediolanus]MCD1572436.1 ABC transporter ATP-binding protein [Agromyces mediolanus]